MKKRNIFLLTLVTPIVVAFLVTRIFMPGKYVADDGYGGFIDGSYYVESGKYYFNCEDGFFVKRVPPELDINAIKKGKFTIPKTDYKGQKTALQKYMATSNWETGFEYYTTSSTVGLFRSFPNVHFFYKAVSIDGKDYGIGISQTVYRDYPLDISINEEQYEPREPNEIYLESLEEAKYSCPDPQ